MSKQDKQIFIRYCANPNWPNAISHKDPNRLHLVKERTIVFELRDYEKAWNFLMECTAPITKLSNILWAFPRKKAFDMLSALDELKITPENFDYEELKEYISDDTIDDTIMRLHIKDKSYSDLLMEGL